MSFPRIVAPLLYLAAALAWSAPVSANLIIRVANIAAISLPDVIEDLKGARVVFVGEQHDNAEHHQAQLAIIRGLVEAGARVAVGLEMFRADGQEALDRWVAGQTTEPQFVRVWADHWDGQLWPVYREIFRYARKQAIPLLGLNIPRSVVNQVARNGFSSLPQDDREALGVVSCNVDPRYQELLAAVMGQKAAGSQAFGRFCEAQVLWDTAMARNLARYVEAHPDRIVVVLGGTFHTWKHGIPERFAELSDAPYRVMLPSSDRTYLRYDILLEDADYVWWHEEPTFRTP